MLNKITAKQVKYQKIRFQKHYDSPIPIKPAKI